MAIAFLIDENMPRAVSHAIVRHNKRGGHFIEAVAIGASGSPPKGTSDSDLLHWAADNNRIVVSYDKKTLPEEFAARLARDHHSPGIFFFKLTQSIPYIVDFLATVAHASDPEDWRDRLFYVD